MNEENLHEEELQKLEVNEKTFLSRIQKLVVNSVETMRESETIRQEIKTAEQSTDKLRKYLIEDPMKHVKKINDRFNPFIKRLKSLDDEVEMKQVAYMKAQEKIREEQEDKLRKEQEAKYQKELKKAEKKDLPAPPPPAPIVIETPKFEGSQVRKEFRAIFEKMEIDKVPEIFTWGENKIRIKIVDEKAVNKLVKAGVRQIPGIPILEEMGIARAKTKEEEL